MPADPRAEVIDLMERLRAKSEQPKRKRARMIRQESLRAPDLKAPTPWARSDEEERPAAKFNWPEALERARRADAKWGFGHDRMVPEDPNGLYVDPEMRWLG